MEIELRRPEKKEPEITNRLASLTPAESERCSETRDKQIEPDGAVLVTMGSLV